MRYLISLMVFLLSGCLTAPPVDTGVVQVGSVFPTTDQNLGIAVAGINLDSGLSQEAANFGFYVNAVSTKEISGQANKYYRSFSVEKDNNDFIYSKSHSFIFLPSGEYVIQSVSMPLDSGITVTCLANSVKFQVKPGEISYIGDLNFSSPLSGFQSKILEPEKYKKEYILRLPKTDLRKSMQLRVSFDIDAAKMKKSKFINLNSEVVLSKVSPARVNLVRTGRVFQGFDTEEEQECVYVE